MKKLFFQVGLILKEIMVIYLFIDLRDNYGITQCVIDIKHEKFNKINMLGNESVIKINGTVIKRSEETINKILKTGEIEIQIIDFELLSASEKYYHYQ